MDNTISHRDLTFLIWLFKKGINFPQAFIMASQVLDQYDKMSAEKFIQQYQSEESL